MLKAVGLPAPRNLRSMCPCQRVDNQLLMLKLVLDSSLTTMKEIRAHVGVVVAIDDLRASLKSVIRV